MRVCNRTITILWTFLYSNPVFGTIQGQGDIKHGYNKVVQEGVLKSMDKTPVLRNTLGFTYTILSPEAYVGMGNGTHLSTVPVCCTEGAHQGAIRTGWHFSLGCNNSF